MIWLRYQVVESSEWIGLSLKRKKDGQLNEKITQEKEQ
jgi:hypothetical protein